MCVFFLDHESLQCALVTSYTRASTRGNNYKLVNHSFHYDLRQHFFLHVL